MKWMLVLWGVTVGQPIYAELQVFPHVDACEQHLEKIRVKQEQRHIGGKIMCLPKADDKPLKTSAGKIEFCDTDCKHFQRMGW